MRGGTVNWLQGIGDPFQEKDAGLWLDALSGLLAIPRALIIAVAVLTGL